MLHMNASYKTWHSSGSVWMPHFGPVEPAAKHLQINSVSVKWFYWNYFISPDWLSSDSAWRIHEVFKWNRMLSEHPLMGFFILRSQWSHFNPSIGELHFASSLDQLGQTKFLWFIFERFINWELASGKLCQMSLAKSFGEHRSWAIWGALPLSKLLS